MKKNAKHTSASTSRAPRRLELFGPPPIFGGETEQAYWELLERVFSALEPADFIDEIWVRDGVDSIWNIFRLRRMLSAFLAEEVRDVVNKRVSAIVEADPGTEEQRLEMARLLNPNSKFSWKARKARYPSAAERYKKFCEAALDLNEIQAMVMGWKMDEIERIQALIGIEERRFDSVIRELDRHRVVQNLRCELQNAKAKIKTVEPKMISDYR
jgi:hypothetical protein